MTNLSHTETASTERQRIRAIIGSDNAKGIETFATYVATETTLNVDQALRTLEIVQQSLAAQPAVKNDQPLTPFEAMMREAADG